MVGVLTGKVRANSRHSCPSQPNPLPSPPASHHHPSLCLSRRRPLPSISHPLDHFIATPAPNPPLVILLLLPVTRHLLLTVKPLSTSLHQSSAKPLLRHFTQAATSSYSSTPSVIHRHHHYSVLVIHLILHPFTTESTYY